jgi:hypothetical protein
MLSVAQTTPALKMVCRLASVPVLPFSMLKRLQDLGDKKRAGETLKFHCLFFVAVFPPFCQ